MRKGKIIGIVLVILLIIALVLGGTYLYIRNDREAKAVLAAETAQQEAYGKFTSLLEQIDGTTLTVTEQGKQIGVYDLAQLGLLEQTRSAAAACFPDWDRRDPAAFASLTAEEKIAWEAGVSRQEAVVTLDASRMDCSAVLLDLSKEIRVAPKNAYAYFDGGSYAIAPEVGGTQLNNDAVAQALRQAVNGKAPGQLTFEVSEHDAYLPAAVTAANGVFDYATLLAHDASGVTITVRLLEGTETLDVAPLVKADSEGVVQVDTDALGRILAGWSEKYRGEKVPYVLNSYVEGPIPLDFLKVDYTLNQEMLTAMLVPLIQQLESVMVEAPFYCTKDGEPFSISGTYVEVDVDNQQMTYYENGEVVVNTPVVTGYPWGHWTPPGLYAVQNIDVDQWLYGEDYTVFVEYWIGFHGAYGIHDASWRTIFGGKKYLSDGSHGCVNTPTEAVSIIHERIEVGVPVVVHDEKEPDDY